SYHQGDFNCCGGGATSPTTSANIPAGLEVIVDGGLFWSASNPKLSGSTFTVDTYCGPGPPGGAGCNIKVTVIAHYRITPATAPLVDSQLAPPAKKVPEVSSTKDQPKSPPSGKEALPRSDLPFWGLGADKFLAFT